LSWLLLWGHFWWTGWSLLFVHHIELLSIYILINFFHVFQSHNRFSYRPQEMMKNINRYQGQRCSITPVISWLFTRIRIYQQGATRIKTSPHSTLFPNISKFLFPTSLIFLFLSSLLFPFQFLLLCLLPDHFIVLFSFRRGRWLHAKMGRNKPAGYRIRR